MRRDTTAGPAPEAAAVEIRLGQVNQLFDSFDPSPFHEKDLDPDAEEYIVGTVDEMALAQPVRLVVHLPAEQLALPAAADLEAAIRNHFARGLEAARRRMRFHLREGRAALLIGLTFLVVCMTLRQIASAVAPAPASDVLAEGLLILGWVAMRRPLQIFLYDWWPIRHRARLFAKLAAMPVEVRAAEGRA